MCVQVQLPPRPRSPRGFRAVLRGLAAVALLFITAADALLTAVLGVPRMTWLARRVTAACGEEYQRARWGAIEVTEVIDIDDPGTSRDDSNPNRGGTRVDKP